MSLRQNLEATYSELDFMVLILVLKHHRFLDPFIVLGLCAD